MGLIRLLFQDPVSFVVVAIALLYSIIAHEVAHGAVALLFGDDTAKRYGRLTLNPVPHIDPFGALMLLLVGFGWAIPVPVNSNALRNSRVALIAVSLAGCLTNLLIAILSLFLLQLPSVNSSGLLVTVLYVLARINIVLCVFNLIPIPPLDGSKILMSFLPWQMQQQLAMIEPYGMFIMVILLFTGVLSRVISVMQDTLIRAIGSLFALWH